MGGKEQPKKGTWVLGKGKKGDFIYQLGRRHSQGSQTTSYVLTLYEEKRQPKTSELEQQLNKQEDILFTMGQATNVKKKKIF